MIDHHCEEACDFLNSLTPEDAVQLQEMMCESAHDDKYDNHIVRQLEQWRLNAINVQANIEVKWGDKTYNAIVRSGDMDGFVIEEWDDDLYLGEQPIPQQYALMPIAYYSNITGQEPEKARLMYAVWKAFRDSRDDFNEIAGKYMYDKHFSPGGKTEQYWHKKAKNYAAKIVTLEDADEAFKKLESFGLAGKP